MYTLKWFFRPGYHTVDGQELSSTAVKDLIAHIIVEESPREPLSDGKIRDLLAVRGVPVARRTVTKYRQKMDIPSSRQRRDWSKTADAPGNNGG